MSREEHGDEILSRKSSVRIPQRKWYPVAEIPCAGGRRTASYRKTEALVSPHEINPQVILQPWRALDTGGLSECFGPGQWHHGMEIPQHIPV